MPEELNESGSRLTFIPVDGNDKSCVLFVCLIQFIPNWQSDTKEAAGWMTAVSLSQAFVISPYVCFERNHMHERQMELGLVEWRAYFNLGLSPVAGNSWRFTKEGQLGARYTRIKVIRRKDV